jgi:hypothetical protein
MVIDGILNFVEVSLVDSVSFLVFQLLELIPHPTPIFF